MVLMDLRAYSKGRDYLASIASTASIASIEVKHDVIVIDAL